MGKRKVLLKINVMGWINISVEIEVCLFKLILLVIKLVFKIIMVRINGKKIAG